MSVSSVNPYGSSQNITTDEKYHVNPTITTSTAIQGKDSSQLDMDDFLNLLVAQMTNQDMLNPTSDTEFIAQMAQFSSLQGMKTLQEYSLSSYAVSYVGKYVTIANQTDSGKLETITGKVDNITFYDGAPKVMVNGTAYDLYTVMEVSDNPATGNLDKASEYIGKTVTVSWTDEFKVEQEHTGVVTGVTLVDGVPNIIIGNNKYPLSAISGIVVPTDNTGDETTSGE